MNDNYPHHPLHPNALKHARELRRECTNGEAYLWKLLRGRRLEGIKFRRQYPWGAYVLDFYAPSAHLAVEVDGDQHAAQQEHDRYRDATLTKAGVLTLRFTTDELYQNLEGVLTKIWTHARGRMR